MDLANWQLARSTVSADAATHRRLDAAQIHAASRQWGQQCVGIFRLVVVNPTWGRPGPVCSATQPAFLVSLSEFWRVSL